MAWQVDILRDEAEDFGKLLEAAQVHVKCKRYNGHFHNSMIDSSLFGEVASLMQSFRQHPLTRKQLMSKYTSIINIVQVTCH